MITIQRTDSSSADFIYLVRFLDKELAERDGVEHGFYAKFNKIDKLQYVVVVNVDGKPVSCGAIKPLEEGIMEVKRMYTLPEFRGKGIASIVLHELESWAKELQMEKCVLETGLRQPEAIALYTKSGYVRIPNYGQYAGVENSVCFEKML